MLLNLLPGLRDLRAPLAAGYLWLAAAWLYYAPRLPASTNEAQGILKDVYRVVSVSNPAMVAAGLTFVAYILGILSTGLLTKPLRLIARLLILLPVYILVLMRVFIATHNGSAAEDKVQDWIDGYLDRFYEPTTGRAVNLASRRIIDMLTIDNEYRKRFIETLKAGGKTRRGN
jgi:hypothetical protein